MFNIIQTDPNSIQYYSILFNRVLTWELLEVVRLPRALGGEGRCALPARRALEVPLEELVAGQPPLLPRGLHLDREVAEANLGCKKGCGLNLNFELF